LSSPDFSAGSPASGIGRDLDLIVIGDCNPDIVVTGDDVTPVFGQHERLVDTMSLLIGGSATITAVAAARLGLRVALVAAIGDDPAGQMMLVLLSREGVQTDAVAIRPGLATGMTTVLSAGSDRAILTALGAITTLTAADIPEDLIGRARHLHVSSYFLLQSSLGPGLPALLAAARRHGLSTSMDTNDDPAGGWGGADLRSALEQVDVFLPNEAEAVAIGSALAAGDGQAAKDEGAAAEDEGAATGSRADLAEAITSLRRICRSVVVKRGADGALCIPSRDSPQRADGAGECGYQVRMPPVRPIDSTGAGDCFNAGLIAGLLRGLDLPEAAALGCAVGAASTRAVGGTGASVDLAAAVSLAAAASITPAGAVG
jgi:sugar/nucleoside kinase (ribokinase family)